MLYFVIIELGFSKAQSLANRADMWYRPTLQTMLQVQNLADVIIQMKNSYHRRMKKIQSRPFDIISDLPRNLIETILICMPIRDAVRTSILSRNWRYRWANLPKLVFDDTLLRGSTGNQLTTTNKLLFTIYQVLLLHRGPILEFTLSFYELEPCSEIDQLLLYLSRNVVEKLTLHFWKGQHYKLPSSFFACLQLTHLDIAYCIFKPPPTFKGFSRLISIDFEDMIFDGETFGRFISSCPLLERLTLISSTNFHFEINALKLKFLCFSGNLSSICFKNAPLLAIFTIHPEVEVEHFKKGRTSALIKLFGSLPVIENLEMDYNFYKSLLAGGVPKKLPTLIHLKILGLMNICFGAHEEVLFVHCLLRSSPNLQQITIEMYAGSDVTDPELEILEAEDFSDVILDQLRKVNIKVVSGTQTELELVKLLLTKSPILETMLIEPESKNVADRLEILQKLTRFQRASPKAEIIYADKRPS